MAETTFSFSRRWKIVTLSILFTLLFLFVLFQQVDVSEVLAALSHASLWLVFLGFLLYIISAYLRSLRYYFLLKKQVSPSLLFQVVAMQTMVINIIPNLIGEFSFLYLIKKLGNIRGGHSFVSMVLARLFDLIAVFVLFLVFIIIADDVPAFMMRVLWVFSLVLLLVLGLSVIFILTKERFCRGLQRCFAALRLTKISVFALLIKKVHEMAEALEEVKSPRVLTYCFFLSIGVWLVSFTLASILINAAGYHFSYSVVALGTTFSKLTSVLPIYGIAGLGTTEGFWSLGFLALGVEKAAAIVTGFSVHLFTLFYTLILGFLFMGKNWGRLFLANKMNKK